MGKDLRGRSESWDGDEREERGLDVRLETAEFVEVCSAEESGGDAVDDEGLGFRGRGGRS